MYLTHETVTHLFMNLTHETVPHVFMKLTHETVTHFMVTPCFNNIQRFNYQLTHTTLKNVELLKHFYFRMF